MNEDEDKEQRIEGRKGRMMRKEEKEGLGRRWERRRGYWEEKEGKEEYSIR